MSFVNFSLLVLKYLFTSLLITNVYSLKELVVKITGGPLVAQLLAQESGHYFKGPVLGLTDTFIFLPLESVYKYEQKRGLQSKYLLNDDRVLWAEVQHIKLREKRDLILNDSDIPKERVKRLEYTSKETESEISTLNNNKSLTDKQKRDNQYNFLNRRLKRYINGIDTTKDLQKRLFTFSAERVFNDELWGEQWYLRDTRSNLDLPKLDLNVIPVYKAGITGKGVRISVLDDGLEYTHDDLRANYDSAISWDINEEDDDPFPRYEPTKANSHGTRCAGEIAMLANNQKCGVGIAFNAKIGGVKMLDGLVTDRIEATALSYAQDLVDIYSASWGPSDDGKTVDGPGRLATEAILNGIQKGRNGKGTIFVWASGNGGHNNDNCNCDGYLTSPYTISIGSASQTGEFPWYGEACASTLAVTYSSGASKDHMIATTDLHNRCTTKHTGTSASAPLAAGIVALALEANRNLTWRDIQHIIVWTSELEPLRHNLGWQQNSAGLWFNERFGFGLMNAYKMVKAASTWVTVPERRTCEIFIPSSKINSTLSALNPVEILIPTSGCKGTQQEIRYLEHVAVKTNINYSVRGALQIHLLSPSDTEVQLLAERKFDKSKDGFVNWTFMSVMTWGEAAEGMWSLKIADDTQWRGHHGYVGDTTLILYGTKHLPLHMSNNTLNLNSNRIQRFRKTFRKGKYNLRDLPSSQLLNEDYIRAYFGE